MNQTEMVIALLNDFNTRVVFDDSKITRTIDYRKAQLIVSLGREIEIQYSKRLFLEKISRFPERTIYLPTTLNRNKSRSKPTEPIQTKPKHRIITFED